MTPKTHWLLKTILIALAFVVSLVGLRYFGGTAKGGTWSSAFAVERKLEKLGKVEELELNHVFGWRLRQEHLRGKIWVFGTTQPRCRTHCSLTVGRMATLQRQFSDASNFQLLTLLTTDSKDQEENLRNYSLHFAANPERWLFVHADMDSAEDFLRKQMSLPLEKAKHLHSSMLVLVDREGVIRGYYNILDVQRMLELRTDIASLLQDS